MIIELYQSIAMNSRLSFDFFGPRDITVINGTSVLFFKAAEQTQGLFNMTAYKSLK